MAVSIYELKSLLYFCAATAVIFGAVMGSFLNCAAWRIAHGESFLKGRSRCPKCGHTLGAAELIPVVSWAVQKGRCKNCKEKISARYPLTELAFAAITAACLMRFDLTVLCLRNYVFLCCLFCLALTDLENYVIPDGCHVISVCAWILAQPYTFSDWGTTGLHVLAALLFGGGILLISILLDRMLGRESLGGGDVKLIAVAGLYLGLAGTLFMIMIACVLGLAFSAALSRRGEAGMAFPFGPAIAAATGFMLLFGDSIVRWYMGLIGI